MRLRKNIARVATFTIVGALGVAGFIAVNNNNLEDTTAVTGSWGNFVNTSWMNESDARYKGYKETPGTTESSPYLIKTAEEFSGIRAFEGNSGLAGKYLMLANDIDLSAHYWDPIEVYGKGDNVNDAYEGYGDGLDLADNKEVVHINGNSMKISGMNIENTYDEVFAGFEGEYYAGATGLFSYTYKASISDIRLDKPVINLTRTGGVPMYNRGGSVNVYSTEYIYGETPVSDIMGSVVGIAQNSHIAGVHVNDLTLNYTAEFGDYVTERCPTATDINMQQSVEGCDAYYSPAQIVAGGAIGMSFGETLVSETSVKGGTVNIAPVVDEEANDDWGMESLHYGGMVSVAGLVGANIQSTVLSTCSSANVAFTDDGYNIADRPAEEFYPYSVSESPMVENEQITDAFSTMDLVEDSRPLNSYSMMFGGLVGFSINPENMGGGERAKCLYNSCSHSEMNIDAEISTMTTVGGISGLSVEDRVMNNYYDGNIKTSEDNIVGETLGVYVQDSYDSTAIRSNFYMNRGNDPIGLNDTGGSFSGFSPISTVEKLAENLNAGRVYVTNDLANNTNLTAAQISLMTTEWSILDGTFPLACTNARSAGLVFPDNRIDVPNTGAK